MEPDLLALVAYPVGLLRIQRCHSIQRSVAGAYRS